MLDAIISGISRIRKNYDLKDLYLSNYLSSDEYYIMKDLAMYGNEYVEFEYFRRDKSGLESSLNDFWEGKTKSKDFFAEAKKQRQLLSGGSSLRFSKIKVSQRAWRLIITENFMSSIKKIDMNLRGRILVAITDINLSPTTSQGDTIKPLTADKKGFWRYRIGDYRLIYQPVEKLREILLISFSSRGSAYQ
jgi:mRNA-degrading endonuclease RelE of RelBE toxin-antitoxin system